MLRAWAPIVGYPGYRVSTDGLVESRKRRAWTRLSGGVNRGGHRQVKLDGVNVYVHRLVLQAFGPPEPADGRMALHYDDVPSNNSITNLRWGTRAENSADSIRNGGHAQASKTRCRYGHLYAGDNLFVRRNGKRECRACMRDRGRRK